MENNRHKYILNRIIKNGSNRYVNIQNCEPSVFYGREYSQTATILSKEGKILNKSVPYFKPQKLFLSYEKLEERLEYTKQQLKEEEEDLQLKKEENRRFGIKDSDISVNYLFLKERFEIISKNKDYFSKGKNKYDLSYAEVWLDYFEDDIWQNEEGKYFKLVTLKEYDTFTMLPPDLKIFNNQDIKATKNIYNFPK